MSNGRPSSSESTGHPPLRKEPAPDLVAQKLQEKKSESLKKLKIGDPGNRVQAVKDLEPFAGDTKVRTTLEQTLLSDRDPQVRKTVAELFGRLQDKSTLRVLKQANNERLRPRRPPGRLQGRHHDGRLLKKSVKLEV